MSQYTHIKTVILASALLSQIGISLTVYADQGIQVNNIHFEQRQTTDAGEFHLRGAGILTWGIWVDLYAAALYTSPDASQLNKRLVIHYFVPIKASKIREIGESFILKQEGQETLARIRPSLDRLHDAMNDVEPGDSYALTLTENGQLILEYNRQEVISITDRTLGEAYLNIWLGKQPIDTHLKLSLLGPANRS